MKAVQLVQKVNLAIIHNYGFMQLHPMRESPPSGFLHRGQRKWTAKAVSPVLVVPVTMEMIQEMIVQVI